MGDFNVWGYLARMGVEVRGPGQEELVEGDRVAGVDKPVILRLEDIEELLHVDYAQFSCQVPGCGLKFSQLHESETHYAAAHRHACSVCRKALPSPHLLEIHIQENHDSFFSCLAEKKASYQCFLPSCTTLFWGAQERHAHAIQIHKFPPDFRFDAVKKKERKKKRGETDKRINGEEKEDCRKNGEGEVSKKESTTSSEKLKSQSAQPTRRPLSLARMGDTAHKRSSMVSLSSLAPGQDPSIPSPGRTSWLSSLDVSQPDSSPMSLTGSGKKSRIPVLRSSSCRVPRNLSFGAGVQRTFVRSKAKHWHQNGEAMDTNVHIDQVDMDQLRSALPI